MMASRLTAMYKYFARLQINQYCTGLKYVSYYVIQVKTLLHEIINATLQMWFLFTMKSEVIYK